MGRFYQIVSAIGLFGKTRWHEYFFIVFLHAESGVS